jgi:hypothetical protein
MKYLKAYESVEMTKNWISEVMNTCKDIMVELEDAGMETEVKRSLSDKSVLIECIIILNNFAANGGGIIKFRKVMFDLEVKMRLIDYMESEGFELTDYEPYVKDGQFKMLFKKSDIDNDYIGHLRYLKKYNIKESVESEDHYKDLADKLFYDVNEYFVEERGRFLPIKVMLSRNSSGNYSGSLCLGPGWAGRMDDDEEDWLFDLVGSYQKEHNIYFGICANSFDSKTFYERTNNAWGDGHDFNNLPDYPFPERLD